MNNFKDIEEFVKKAKDGDRLAMEELMKSFKYYIYKCASKIYVSGYDHDDLMQVGYIAVMKAAEKYDISRGNFTGYVTLAISNNLNYLIRSHSKDNANASLNYEMGEDGMTLEEVVADDICIEDEYISMETNSELGQAIDSLSINLKEIIDYVYVNSKGTLKDYANNTGINYNTVVKRKNLALKKLREKIF